MTPLRGSLPVVACCEFTHKVTNFTGKNLTYGHFGGTEGRPFSRESGIVRSKGGFCIEFNRKNVWDRPESFIEEGCSPEQSVR